MKVGFIVDSGTFGGAEKQSMILGEELRKSGHEVVFLLLNENNHSDFGKKLKELNFSFYDLNFTFHSDHIRRILNILPLLFKIRKFKLDILLPYTIRPNVNINPLWQITGAKLCIWNQRDEGRGMTLNNYRDKILLLAIRNTSGIISNSIDGYEFMSNYVREPKKIKLINNGVKIKPPNLSRQEILDQMNIPQSSFIVLKIANITKYKDHETLLHAWNIFLQRTKVQHPVLLLAGIKGETFKAIEKIAESSERPESIRFLGHVEDINSIAHACDLSVFSSVKEGIPNGVLEPMAAGKAVIASDILGNRQALGNEYPYFFETGNIQSLANLLLELSENEQYRLDAGKLNKIRILNQFNPEILASKTLSFIKELTDE